MAMTYPIFLPLPPHHSLTLSHPSSDVWVIELHNGADSRLTKNYILNAILPALDHVERAWRTKLNKIKDDMGSGKGGLVITGNLSQDKFFSNGLNLEEALADSGFWTNVFYPLMRRLLTFPIPTIAAINGHAFAGGWLLAAWCDYRVMSSGKCWGSMPEIYLGSGFPHALIVSLRVKLRDHLYLRKQVLEGHKWTPQELLAAGMVDEIVEGGSQRILKHALDLAQTRSGDAKTGVYGLIKRAIYHEVLEATKLDLRLITPAEDDETALRELSLRSRL